MNRPTTSITLPISKKEVLIKDWITGREYEEANSPMYKNFKMKADAYGVTSAGEFDGSIAEEMNKAAIQVWVQSLDSSAENVVDRLLDLPAEDYLAVVAAINEKTKKKEE